LIEVCTNLDFLFLTKRVDDVLARFGGYWGLDKWPDNIWIGTSVEDQQRADERVPELLKIPAKVKFLSVEPMLEEISLTPALYPNGHTSRGERGLIDWVICGGESGAGCRPMELKWVYNLAAQCVGSGVPFFMKQLGGHPSKRDKLVDFPEDLRVREYPTPDPLRQAQGGASPKGGRGGIDV
jgi:protein gp37